MRIFSTGFLLLLIVFHCALFAQQKEFVLDSIIVNATHIPETLKESAKSITVITQKDLNESHISNLNDLLNELPGVNMNNRNLFGVQSDIGMRGSTFAQVLVLIDNVRLNDPLTGHFNDNFPVPVSDIHHIEIIRGPAAVSFGVDAVGGLIHIKTKTYVNHIQQQYQDNNTDIAAQAIFGQHNTLLSEVGVSLQKNKWITSASLKAGLSDGEERLNPNYTAGIASDSLYRNHFDLKNYQLSSAYWWNDKTRLFGRVAWTQRFFDAKYFYTQSLYDESVETTNSLWTQLNFRQEYNKGSLEFNTGYKNTDDLFVFNSLFAPNEHQTQQFFNSLVFHQRQNEKLSWAAGGQYLLKLINSTDRGNHKDYHTGLFAMMTYRFFPELKTSLGIRTEYNPIYGFQLLPQLSLAFIKENYTLRALAGKSIRTPDFTEKYISYQIPELSPGRNAGNPGLDAEQSYSFELGVDWRSESNLKLSATVFYRMSDRLIDYVLTNADDIGNLNNLQAGETYYYAQNIADSKTQGLEFIAEKQIPLSKNNNRLNLSLAYTYLNTSNKAGIVSKYIANHPKHSLNGKLNLYAGIWSFKSNIRFIERKEERNENINGLIPQQYMVLNAQTGIRIPKTGLSFFVKVNNITNNKYQEIIGVPLPQRWWLAGFQWE